VALVVGVAGGNDGPTDANLVAVDASVDSLLNRAALDVAPIPPPPTETSSVPVVPLAVETSVVENVQPDIPPDTQAVPETSSIDVALTFFVCVGAPAGFDDGYCGRMANGETVHDGAAACGYRFQIGDRFRIVGDSNARVYTCEDRGLGASLWIDVWFYDYASGRAWRNTFPKYVTVEMVP